MAASAGATLLTNATATGALLDWPGGIGVFVAVGTFSGATVKLQFVGPDGTTLVDAGTATTLTAAGAGVFYLGPCQVKATISAGPPSGIYASVSRVNG